MKRWFVPSLVIVCVVATLAYGRFVKPDSPRNVIFIVLDTTRADGLEPYGYPRPTSPSLRAFAEESLVFERAYSHVPWTVPSVASILTSVDPNQHGISEWGQRLLDEFTTLPEVFSSQGYLTHGIVSHHALREEFNLHQGFDSYDYSIVEANVPHLSSTAPLVTELGLESLDRLMSDESPFFLWLHYFDAHNDYMEHEGIDFGNSPRDRYDGELLYQDRALADLFEGIRERSLDKSTVVVVMADHGEEFKEHGKIYHTGQLYEESVRIPLMIRHPSFAPKRLSGLVAETDVAPTLLAMLGMPIPEQFEGMEIGIEEPILPAYFFRELEEPRRESVYLETFRFGYKQGLVTSKFKLILDHKQEQWELYDLGVDPSESKNVYSGRVKMRRTLRKQLAEYTSRTRRLLHDRRLDDETMDILKSLGYVE